MTPKQLSKYLNDDGSVNDAALGVPDRCLFEERYVSDKARSILGNVIKGNGVFSDNVDKALNVIIHNCAVFKVTDGYTIRAMIEEYFQSGYVTVNVDAMVDKAFDELGLVDD